MVKQKNKNQNKTIVKTKQVVNIINNKPRRRGKLMPSTGSVIRNIYHSMPTFHPIYNQPQPVGTRPDDTLILDSIKRIQETVLPLQEAILNIQRRDALETPRKIHNPFAFMGSGS